MVNLREVPKLNLYQNLVHGVRDLKISLGIGIIPREYKKVWFHVLIPPSLSLSSKTHAAHNHWSTEPRNPSPNVTLAPVA